MQERCTAPKWFIILALLYISLLAGMFFVGLGKFASIAFADDWWSVTKDFASIVGSLSTAFGVLWGVGLYFKQKEQARVDKWHEQARNTLDQLIPILTPEQLLPKQLTINSLLYRLRSYIRDFDKPIHSNYLLPLRTCINQLFRDIKIENLIKYESPSIPTPSQDPDDLNALTGENRSTTFNLAVVLVSSKQYQIFEIGDEIFVQLKDSFDPQLLSNLVLIAQPICNKNFTYPATDVQWKQERLKDLFEFLPSVVASYLYIAFSEQGHELIKRLDQEINKGSGGKKWP